MSFYKETVVAFWDNVLVGPDCWEWQGGLTSSGYGRTRVGAKPGGKVYAHRLSLELLGFDTDGACVLHTCDNPRCVRPGHLWLGSKDDNNKDRTAKGRSKPCSGEKHGRAKVTWEIAEEIRLVRWLQPELTYKYLSSIYGISVSAVGSIIRYETWQKKP